MTDFRAYDFRFLQAKAMPDGQLAVAIGHGNDVFVGLIAIWSLDIRHDYGRAYNLWQWENIYAYPRSRTDVDISTICTRWKLISRAEYDEATWHTHVPTEESKLPAPVKSLSGSVV